MQMQNANDNNNCINSLYKYDDILNCYMNLNDDLQLCSDGNKEEEYVYNVIKNAKDRTEFSKELISAIKDWPSYYHLSPTRNNIIRPIKKFLKGVGLEVGAGMGALTREIAKSASLLYSLEENKRQARVIGKRCEDLENVKVLIDNIMKFPIKGLDFITLIGVFENASYLLNNNSNDENPHLSILKKLKETLNDDGFLILAVENKLGLKYLSGAKEDYSQIPYVGIQDLYKKGDPRAFTRQELISMLHEAGFDGLKFYYPFPDYKQPKAIICENAFGREDFNIASFISLGIKEVYPQGGCRFRNFSQEAAWRTICKNKNLQDLSNSFLIVATKNPQTFQKYIDSDIAFACAATRIKEFVTEVKVTSINGKLQVKREKIYNDAEKNENLCVKHIPCNEDYIEGESYFTKIFPLISTPNFKLVDFAKMITPWVNYLLQFAIKDNDSDKILISEKYLDCTPTNLIITKDNRICTFDFEWKYKKDYIPLLWVIHRGIQNILLSVEALADSKDIENKPAMQVIWEIIVLLGFNVKNEDVEEIYRLENELQTDVTGFHQDVRGVLSNPLNVRRSIAWYEDKLNELIKIIYAYEDKLNKMNNVNA